MRIKQCAVCGKDFECVRSTAQYCTEHSRASAHKARDTRKARTVARRKAKLPDADDWRYLASQCRRAGTVEILHGMTVADLSALFYLFKRKRKAHGGDFWHLCHMHPVGDRQYLGLLNTRNLVIGPARLNQSAGVTVFGGGESLNRGLLKTQWRVPEKASNNEILEKIVKYLGSVLDEYLEDNPVEVSERLTLSKWIAEHDDECSVSEMYKLSVQELRELKHCIQKPIDEKGERMPMFKLKALRQREHIVTNEECKRLAGIVRNPDHVRLLEFGVHLTNVSCVILKSYGDDGYDDVLTVPVGVNWKPLDMNAWLMPDEFNDFVSVTCFELCMGRGLDDVDGHLDALRARVKEFVHCQQWKPEYDVCQPLLKAFGDGVSSGVDYEQGYERFEISYKEIQESMFALGLEGVGCMTDSDAILPDEERVFAHWEQNAKPNGDYYRCPF